MVTAADHAPMPHPRSNHARKRLVVVCLAAVALECFAFWVWITLDNVWGMVLALLLHALQAAILIFAAPKTPQNQESVNAIHYMAAFIAFFMPGLGILGFTAALAAQLMMRPKGLAKDFEKHMMLLDESLLLDSGEEIETFLRNELSTEPMADIVNSDDRELKRGAIKLLRDRGGNAAIGLIRRFLHDPDAEVRLYAHTALVRMQEHMSRQIEEAEEAAQTGGVAEAMVLARLYREYAESELTEDALSGHYLNQACKALSRAMDMEPHNMRLRLRLGEMQLLSGRYIEARSTLEAVTQEPALALEAHLALCQIHYECRDLASLSQEIQTMRSAGLELPEDSAQIALYRFWTNPGLLDSSAPPATSAEENAA